MRGEKFSPGRSRIERLKSALDSLRKEIEVLNREAQKTNILQSRAQKIAEQIAYLREEQSKTRQLLAKVLGSSPQNPQSPASQTQARESQDPRTRAKLERSLDAWRTKKDKSSTPPNQLPFSHQSRTSQNVKVFVKRKTVPPSGKRKNGNGGENKEE